MGRADQGGPIVIDLDAEKALITSALLSKQAFLDVTSMIEPDHFMKPAHQHIWEAIEQCAPETNDPILVAERLQMNGWDGAEYTASGLNGFYCDLSIPTTCISHARRYAKTLVDEHARRQLIHAISEGASQMSSGIDAAAARDELVSKLASVSTLTDIREPMTAEDFIGSIALEYDWLIPGMLERGDRLMITGGEGSGKSTLLTQIAFMAAAGIHPWTLKPFEPVRCLLVDLENGNRLVARRMAMMQRAINASRKDMPEPWRSDRIRIEHRSGGIDLTSAVDRDWLASLCVGGRIELLVIGPTYRMYKGAAAQGDSGGEDQARRATAAIDDLRTHCGLTVILETHAPHATQSGNRDLRPIGSSVWLRWPEFGLGLRPVPGDDPNRFELSRFRGDRDERQWPEALYRHSKPWPWVATMG